MQQNRWSAHPIKETLNKSPARIASAFWAPARIPVHCFVGNARHSYGYGYGYGYGWAVPSFARCIARTCSAFPLEGWLGTQSAPAGWLHTHCCGRAAELARLAHTLQPSTPTVARIMLSQLVTNPVVRRAPALLSAAWAFIVLLAAPGIHAQTRPLNDTGQTQCFDATNAPVAVTQANCGDSAARPRQDARYGRDAQAAAGTLSKIGAGAAGFDFTKIANNGSTLPASATLGSNPADWACTKDNVTGLIWEVKTTSGLRDAAHTYTWYSTDATTNGGNAGTAGTDTCGGTLAAAPYNNQCNTRNFTAAVNAAMLCGANDWRMPTEKELLSIVHAGAVNPSIDSAYFPNAPVGYWFWTRSTYAVNPAFAWIVDFDVGVSNADLKSYNYAVRLVRGGQ